ncbi:MAG: GFA family protein, partial [Candidatus Micropelagos thuwalensis]
MITGSCLCGQLSYELDETKTEAQLHCHCRDCQKVTGSGKATIVMLPRENLKLSGE